MLTFLLHRFLNVRVTGISCRFMECGSGSAQSNLCVVVNVGHPFAAIFVGIADHEVALETDVVSDIAVTYISPENQLDFVAVFVRIYQITGCDGTPLEEAESSDILFQCGLNIDTLNVAGENWDLDLDDNLHPGTEDG